MATLKDLTLQSQPSGSGVGTDPTEPNHFVRLGYLSTVVAPLQAARHSPLAVLSSQSVTLTLVSGTQNLGAAVRLKSSGGLALDSNGIYVRFGTGADEVVAGATYVAGLAGKADANHTHSLAGLPEVSAALSDKAAAIHNHAIGDINLLQVALDGKAPISSTWSMSSITGLTTALAGKAPTGHSHTLDSLPEVGAAIDEKADSDHTHAVATAGAAGFMSATDKVKVDSLTQNTYWLAPVATKANLPLNTGPLGAKCTVIAERRDYVCISLVGFVDDQWLPGSTLKRTFWIGDGSSTVFDLPHNLNTWDVVPAFQNVSTREGMIIDWKGLNENSMRVTFGIAPPSSGVRATIVG